MTSNEFYGKVNKRFEKRSKELRELGYKYSHLLPYDIAGFILYRRTGKIEHTIPAATVLYACKRVWQDVMDTARLEAKSV